MVNHALLKQTDHINGLVQERRNSIANAMELRLSCANPSTCWLPCYHWLWRLHDYHSPSLKQLGHLVLVVTRDINSLVLGRFEINFRQVIFQLKLVIDGCGISCEIVLRWKSMELPDDKSALVQVKAWCRQATSHYLSQCWPRSILPYGVTRPQWVNSLWPIDAIWW